MKKIVLFITCLLIATSTLWAADYDFSAVCESGQTLYYKYNNGSSGSSVTIVPQNKSYPYYTTKPTGNLVIPSSVSYNGKTYAITSIGLDAFHYCSELTSVTIPNSIINIRDGAFSGCSKLTSVTIPNSVTSIEEAAFKGCSGLTSVTIPNSVTSIGNDAFSECTYLTSVTIPNSVTSIGEGAFYDTGWWEKQPNGIIYKDGWCLGRKGYTPSGTLTIKNGTKGIANVAFADCTGLTSITIPNSVTSIGDYAFSECDGLTSFSIPNSVTSIGYRAFYNTGWWNNQSDGIIYKNGWCFGYKGNNPTGPLIIQEGTIGIADLAFELCGFSSVTIPSTLKSIGAGAFFDCSELTSVTIPNSVTSIGDYAFYKCTGLTSVTIGSGVTSIGESAFYKCTGLTSVTIPNSVTSIGKYAFYGCTGLTKITCEAVTPPEIGDYTFSSYSVPLYVSLSTYVSAYKNHKIWGNFTNIIALAYIITANSNDNNMGSVSGSGTYESGTNATITATPATHYHFVQWNDGNKENPRQITVTEDKTYTATFAIDIYSVTTLVNNSNWGSVAGGGSYQFNATTTLTATPNEHYHFVQWSDGNTNNPRQVNVTDNITLTANFAPNTYTVTVNANNNMGRVSGGGSYGNGAVVTLTAIPNAGYKFVSWSDGSTQNPRQITVSGDVFLSANFETDIYTVSYTLTVLSANESMGVVTGSGTYVENGTAILSAVPQAGYKFVGWNDGNTDNPRNVTVTGNATYIATFIQSNGTDAIAEATGSNAQIFGGEKRIIINNAANAMVAIYDVMGRTVVKEQRINTNNAVFAMPQRGMYIVRMGKAAKKVFVK